MPGLRGPCPSRLRPWEEIFFLVEIWRGPWRTGTRAGPEERGRGGQPAADSELAVLLRCLGGAQANNNGWPTFKEKYVEYPKFKKEWWAYRRTYHSHLRNELACQALKDRNLSGEAKAMIGDIEGLDEVWDTLDTCYDHPEKYITEALDPVIKFRKDKVNEHAAIREFFYLLRAAMMGARKACLLHRLISDQTLSHIMARMPWETGKMGQGEASGSKGAWRMLSGNF
jgi:hypothetical protein